MKFVLTRTIAHPKIEEPINNETSIEARSLCAAIKKIKCSGKQACDLKNELKTTWEDDLGGTHTLEIKEVETHGRTDSSDLAGSTIDTGANQSGTVSA